MTHIISLLYENSDDDKFILDPHTNTQKINPKWLKGIKEFNFLKRFTINCMDKATGLVDIDLIKTLVDQVDLRIRMIKVEMDHKGVEFETDMDGLYQRCLFELMHCEPMNVETKIAPEGQILHNISDKLEAFQHVVIQQMDEMRGQIKDIHKVIIKDRIKDKMENFMTKNLGEKMG